MGWWVLENFYLVYLSTMYYTVFSGRKTLADLQNSAKNRKQEKEEETELFFSYKKEAAVFSHHLMTNLPLKITRNTNRLRVFIKQQCGKGHNFLQLLKKDRLTLILNHIEIAIIGLKSILVGDRAG